MSKTKPILPLEAAPGWLIKAAASELALWRRWGRRVNGLAITSIGVVVARANQWPLPEAKSVLGQLAHLDPVLVEAIAKAPASEAHRLLPPRSAEQLKLL